MANKQQLLEKVICIFSEEYTEDEWDIIYRESGIFVDKIVRELGSLCEGMKVEMDIKPCGFCGEDPAVNGDKIYNVCCDKQMAAVGVDVWNYIQEAIVTKRKTSIKDGES